MKRSILIVAMLAANVMIVQAQQPGKPEDTEVWTPVPAKVSPAKVPGAAPSDAIVLFDGKDLDQWENSADAASAEKWKLSDGIMTVDKSMGDIQTKEKFMDFQLHIEYRIPENITGSGQGRGNSGIFLAALPGVLVGMSCKC
ncbi:3-keto-disaccharide hydrolase [Pedobacter panaciterrae]